MTEKILIELKEAWGYKERLKHLTMKLISFKAVVWYVGTALLVYDRITGDMWIALSLGLAGLNTYGKYEHRKHLRSLDGNT